MKLESNCKECKVYLFDESAMVSKSYNSLVIFPFMNCTIRLRNEPITSSAGRFVKGYTNAIGFISF